MQIADALLVLAAAAACTACDAPSRSPLDADREDVSDEEPLAGWTAVELWTTFELPKLSFRMPPGFVRKLAGGCVDQFPTYEADEGRTETFMEYLGDTRMIELDPDAFSELERHVEIVSGRPAEIVHGRLKSPEAAGSAPGRYIAVIWRGLAPSRPDGVADVVQLVTISSEPSRDADLERIIRSARLGPE